MRSVGQNAKKHRKRLGISQPDLAGRMGTLGYGWDGGVVSRFESGRRVLRLDEVLDVAYCLGVPLAALLKGTEERHVAVVKAKGKRITNEFTHTDSERAREEERTRQTLYRTARILHRTPEEVRQAVSDLYGTTDLYVARRKEFEALGEDGSEPANSEEYRVRLFAAARKVREAIDTHLDMMEGTWQ